MVFRQDKEIKKSDVNYSLDIYHVSKSFNKKTLKKGGYTTLKSLILNPFKHEKSTSHEKIHAVNDLTIRVPKGKSVGIIGRNGAGKSTLLKLISGIYKPTSGSIKVNGRIAALIELGAGFHPDFTGRENIYLGGAMHGMSKKEIDKVFDDIVEFSELEDFIDAPIRTYSSGMFMRLGFSLAIHTDPEILIVDEVLAVGDASFNAKCKDKLFEIRKKEKTLLLVSHDLNAVQEWCDEVVWIEKGEVVERGEPKRVVDAYVNFVNKKDSDRVKEINQRLLEKADDAQNNEQEINTQNEVKEEENKVETKNIIEEIKEEKIKEKIDENEEVSKEEIIEKTAENKKGGELGTPSRWGSREIEITGVSLLDGNGEENYVYSPKDEMSIKINYKMHEEVKEPIWGISINRSDGLVLFGTNTDIENIKVKLDKKEGEVIFKISSINILPAKYNIDVAVHAKDGYSFDYQKNVLNFLVRFQEKQAGLCYMNHEWIFK